MHRVNAKASDKLGWRKLQQAQIDELGVPEVRAAFPGSMLFNHILVPGKGALTTEHSGFSVPDVSHIVYEYCDGSYRNKLFDDALIVDVGGQLDEKSIVIGIRRQLQNSDVKRIIVLGVEAYQQHSEAIRLSVDKNIEVQVFEPDWMSATMLHSLYRQATMVLFINNMRVLDAVSTGCPSCLVVGSEFRKEPAFYLLHFYLNAEGCEVYDEAGGIIADVKSTLQCHGLVENNLALLQKALDQNNAINDSDDWFADLVVEPSVSVIKPCSSSSDTLLSGLQDKKTGMVRKMVKLRDDPCAFLLDSKFPPLRMLGRVFQGRQKACR